MSDAERAPERTSRRSASRGSLSLALTALTLASLVLLYPLAPVPALAALVSGVLGMRVKGEPKVRHLVACVVGGFVLLLFAAALVELLPVTTTVTVR
ncbi:hypothetical protein KCV87_34205 [Actinosynnema pretiosum subsp. pretiosum]|uniref:Uncharacterized protein n=2 Tax=Actinosynnema TaxID=40566 RepID=C6WIT1_ACTMD|nr:hypothetical protein [Actinosynnema mirum]ACU38171.1 hypothetical protein Amir_4318 [Actinosynnema mirum DSM 43827]AXX31673.1 hypothetical protein APASM_4308 [Actinosynnema pretiosum subsp. pretiosum]QUF04311.1 hypothetical protein KCV87_34205 [Actinosynnema pretiosum subsp. pretiosum]